MKKLLLLSTLCLLGCNKSNQITITKVEGSTAYDNAKLSLNSSQTTESGRLFSFDLENYELGVQSPRAFDYHGFKFPYFDLFYMLLVYVQKNTWINVQGFCTICCDVLYLLFHCYGVFTSQFNRCY